MKFSKFNWVHKECFILFINPSLSLYTNPYGVTHMVWSWNLHQCYPLEKHGLSLLSCNTRVFYRSETKRGPDALFQVPWLLLNLNFARYIGITKDYYKWRHHDCRMTWLQLTGHIQNGDHIYYLRFSKHWYLQILSDMLYWQRNLTNGIISVFTTVKWSGYNVETRYKMRSRFDISGSPTALAFKFCQICKLAK